MKPCVARAADFTNCPVEKKKFFLTKFFVQAILHCYSQKYHIKSTSSDILSLHMMQCIAKVIIIYILEPFVV